MANKAKADLLVMMYIVDKVRTHLMNLNTILAMITDLE